MHNPTEHPAALAQLLLGIHGNFLAVDVADIQAEAVTITMSGSVRTHVVGQDPDDGSAEWHDEPVDHDEIIPITPHMPVADICQRVRHAVLHVEDVVRELVPQGYEWATNL